MSDKPHPLDWHGDHFAAECAMPDMPGPNETRLNLIDGVEYITLRADDFRAEIGRLTHLHNLDHSLADQREAQNNELHRQIEYVRSLVWDDISARDILVNLRNMLDRPKRA